MSCEMCGSQRKDLCNMDGNCKGELEETVDMVRQYIHQMNLDTKKTMEEIEKAEQEMGKILHMIDVYMAHKKLYEAVRK